MSGIAGVLGSTAPLAAPGRLTAASSNATETFESVLGRSSEAIGAESSLAERERVARQAAEQLVAVALVQPMLEMARAGYDPAPPFHQTAADKQFGAITDATTALDIVRSADWAVVDRLAQDVLRSASEAAARDRAASDGV
ncbi:MAG: hypothetical protein AAFR38_04520 [Planctomycetota bacterium]